MANLKDILNLAKADGGKFFVMDEQGDVKLVIMDIEDYEKTLIHKLQKQVEDIEQINREITKIQLQEPDVSVPVAPPARSNPVGPTASNHTVQNHRKYQDLREEVIDPSFDFEGPKLNLDDL